MYYSVHVFLNNLSTSRNRCETRSSTRDGACGLGGSALWMGSELHLVFKMIDRSSRQADTAPEILSHGFWAHLQHHERRW